MLSKYNFRGIVGVDLKENDVKQFAKKVVRYIYSNNLPRTIIMAKDNRESGDYLLSVASAVFTSCGIEVGWLGVATTPMLVYLTSRFKFGLGVMVTASHNPKEYNGFKVFNSCGEGVDVCDLDICCRALKKYTKIVDVGKLKEVYWRELKNGLNPNKIKCVFDCANGASVEIIRKVFPRHQMIGSDTSGKCINDNYGTQDLRNIQAVCKRYKKIGFAFDGDGDRVIAIDENGKVIDGDKILYILAMQNLGFGDRVVGTKLTSLGLEVSLRRLGVSLIRERVGAKYVARRMSAENIILGGESCGHIFLGYRVNDAVRTVIELLNILNRTGMTFEQLLSGYKQMFGLSKDINVEDVKKFNEIEKFNNDVRVVVRKSGTENVVRVFVEGESENKVKDKMQQVLKQIVGEG